MGVRFFWTLRQNRNDQIRMTNGQLISQIPNFGHCSFEIPWALVLGHWSFRAQRVR
jgi:hypothetical protein